MQYEFDPKKLLGSILSIFVHVFAADGEHRFATAIAEDARSYRPQNFTEASAIAAERDLPGFTSNMLIALDDLADAVQQATVLRVQADDEVRLPPPHCLPLPAPPTALAAAVYTRKIVNKKAITGHAGNWCGRQGRRGTRCVRSCQSAGGHHAADAACPPHRLRFLPHHRAGGIVLRCVPGCAWGGRR